MGALRSAALALEFGFIVGAFMVAGILGGRWIDDRLGTAPFVLLGGILLALASSVYVMYLIFSWQRGGNR
ncbi:MAG: AtpZ/AtpI family protein [Chloroflexota bacterium]|nr:AtpZ/AtpI family protein [Chloroflexota bacterium]